MDKAASSFFLLDACRSALCWIQDMSEFALHCGLHRIFVCALVRTF
jgi:hypothetical protein